MPNKKASSAEMITKINPQDGSYINDVQAAILLQSPRGGRLILYVIILFSITALVWSWFAEIDDVIKGQGRVVPSSHIQQIQNLEGGVLKEVLVNEGQIVKKGENLAIIDDIQFSAELERNALDTISYQAAIERLTAESQGREIQFSEELVMGYPNLVQEQTSLAKSQSDNLQNQIDVLQYSKKEKEQELNRLKKKLESSREKYELALQELNTLAPMLESGAVSVMEILRTKQKVAQEKSDMIEATFAIPATETAVLEAKERMDQAVTDYQERSQRELNEIIQKYKGLLAIQKSLQDKVERTAIRSPVYGTIKKIFVDTLGGTIRPGMTIMDIVPLDDTLLIETKVSPKDIGFIRQNQEAKVKLSAYDFSTYGGLEGKVERVSADSITDDKGRTFFIINVSIPQNHIGKKEDNLIVIPGMQAEVDVVVTKRRIIDWVLRPILKSKYN